MTDDQRRDVTAVVLQALKAEEEIEKLNDVQSLDADLGLRLFDWSQNVAELWR